MPLSEARYFTTPKTIPTDVPLPGDTLPFALTKDLRSSDMTGIFGWQELSVAHFLRHLLSPNLSGPTALVETNILASGHFAEKVGRTRTEICFTPLTCPRMRTDTCDLISSLPRLIARGPNGNSRDFEGQSLHPDSSWTPFAGRSLFCQCHPFRRFTCHSIDKRRDGARSL